MKATLTEHTLYKKMLLWVSLVVCMCNGIIIKVEYNCYILAQLFPNLVDLVRALPVFSTSSDTGRAYD